MNFMKNVRTQFTVVDNVFHYIRLHQITMDLLYVIRKISPTDLHAPDTFQKIKKL